MGLTINRRPTQIAVFCLFQCFAEKEYQTERNLPERDFWNEHDPEDLDPTLRHQPGGHEVGGAPTPWARPPPSWAPRSSTDLLVPRIYTHVPRKHPGAPRNPISTAATFYTREIPSWSLKLKPTTKIIITANYFIVDQHWPQPLSS